MSADPRAARRRGGRRPRRSSATAGGLRDELADGVRAVRGGQGGRLWPRGGGVRRGRRWRGGASWLGGRRCGRGGRAAARIWRMPAILTMGALDRRPSSTIALAAASDVAVWQPAFAELVAERGRQLGIRPRLHVKYDTGMGRLGQRDPDAVLSLVDRVAADEGVELVGPLDPLRDRRRAGFGVLRRAARALRESGRARSRAITRTSSSTPPTAPRRCGSADSHFDMVRCGIAIYGLDPFQADPAAQRLEPALELRSYVADVKRFERRCERRLRSALAGARRHLGRGASDRLRGRGPARALTNNADALVGGAPVPARRNGLMDNVTIDVGPDPAVEPGSPAVLIGAAGRRADPLRGGGAAAWDDQLRDHLRDLGPGAAGPRSV